MVLSQMLETAELRLKLNQDDPEDLQPLVNHTVLTLLVGFRNDIEGYGCHNPDFYRLMPDVKSRVKELAMERLKQLGLNVSLTSTDRVKLVLNEDSAWLSGATVQFPNRFQIANLQNYTGSNVLVVSEGSVLYSFLMQGSVKVEMTLTLLDAEQRLFTEVAKAVGLPDPEPGVFYIVNRDVFIDLRERNDLVYPLNPHVTQYGLATSGFVGR